MNKIKFITFILLFALLSISVSAAQHIPCSGPEDTSCPEGETCQLYGESYACGIITICNCDNDLECENAFGPNFECDLTACFIGRSNGLCVEKPSIFDLLLDQSISENLLLDKELFVSHVIKEETFQLDVIEITAGLQDAFVENFEGDENTACEFLPALFMVPKKEYRYGKLDEIDAILDKLAIILRTQSDREQHGVSESQFNLFQSAKAKAESDEQNEDFLFAARAKCCAYNALKHTNIELKGDRTCRPPEKEKGPGGGLGTIANGYDAASVTFSI